MILESLGVRFNGLVGRVVSEAASPGVGGDARRQVPSGREGAVVRHMAKTRDGGDHPQSSRLAVKGRF